jgi:hypothetical protein
MQAGATVGAANELDGSMPCYSVIVYNITNGLPQHPLLIEDSLYALHMCCLLHSPSPPPWDFIVR